MKAGRRLPALVGILAIIAAGVGLIAMQLWNHSLLHIYVPDVGHGACALVVAHDGSIAVFDCGCEDGRPDMKALLLRVREDQARCGGGSLHLDWISVSHSDKDHSNLLGPLCSAMENAQVRVAAFRFLGPTSNLDQSLSACLLRGQAKVVEGLTIGTPVWLASRLTALPVHLQTADVPGGQDSQPDARSAAFVLCYGAFRAWIAGDLVNSSREGAIVKNLYELIKEPQVDLYLLGHDEAKTGSRVLSCLDPHVILVQNTQTQAQTLIHALDRAAVPNAPGKDGTHTRTVLSPADTTAGPQAGSASGLGLLRVDVRSIPFLTRFCVAKESTGGETELVYPKVDD